MSETENKQRARKAAMNLKPFEGSLADPATELVILTSKPHPHPGPFDRVEPSHAACEKFERALSREFIENVKARGIIEPVVGLKDGRDRFIVLAGRRRTRAARVANEEIAAENAKLAPGETPRPLIKVKVVRAQIAEDDRLGIRGVLYSENTQREDYSPTQKAQEIADFQRDGADLTLIAQTFNLKPAAVKQYLALLDCAKEVRDAVDAGLAVSAAAALAELPRDEQVKRLAEAGTVGKRGPSARTVARAVRAAKQGRRVTDRLDGEGRSREELRFAAAGAQEKMVDAKRPDERLMWSVVALVLKWAESGVDSLTLKLDEVVELGRTVAKRDAEENGETTEGRADDVSNAAEM